MSDKKRLPHAETEPSPGEPNTNEHDNKTERSDMDERISKLEMKVSLLIWLALALLSVTGVIYWKLWDVGKEVGSLNSKVDGYDKEAFMQLVSSIEGSSGDTLAAKELRQAVEAVVKDTIEKKQRGESVQPGLYYELGKFCVTNGRLEHAIEYFQKAVEGNSFDYRAHSSLGACYLWLGQKQKDQTQYYATKAVDVLKKAIEINPNHLKAHSNLGIAYYLVGHRKEAIDEWNTAIKIDHQDEAPYYNFACMYAREGNVEQALSFLEKAVINCNYNDLAELDNENDFESLRSNPKFLNLRDIIIRRNKNAVTP